MSIIWKQMLAGQQPPCVGSQKVIALSGRKISDGWNRNQVQWWGGRELESDTIVTTLVTLIESQLIHTLLLISEENCSHFKSVLNLIQFKLPNVSYNGCTIYPR